jgi:hypothetical protein
MTIFNFGGGIDPVETVSAGSMTLRKSRSINSLLKETVCEAFYLLFSSVSYNNDNNSELKLFHKSFQDCLVKETDHGNGF